MALTSCASTRPITLTPDTLSVVASAEAFVLRHGLTAAGHPKDLPVERIELLEGFGFESDQDLIKKRLNWVEPKAFAVDREGRDWFVLFRTTSGDNCNVAIVVTGGKAWKQMHACYEIPSKRVLVLPPNNSFKPKPLRGSA
ncbi:hypothetical protein [Lysobacter sp. CFH 32150]|uniref:hypothetical protein n=1 Tax=Lysobacter sp. CFH 32150 TaxID=2927128 RepID=UPI001FA7F26F|nr:hypothetical protein [Lysobacter sp. CFH 32150]MCI4569042.1 hypothetical protein [Lysobacter sp. CFH 32150]